MTTACCGNCEYANPEILGGGGTVAVPVVECRRYPPQVIVVAGDAMQTFPNVEHDDWCGEHRPRLEQ